MPNCSGLAIWLKVSSSPCIHLTLLYQEIEITLTLGYPHDLSLPKNYGCPNRAQINRIEGKLGGKMKAVKLPFYGSHIFYSSHVKSKSSKVLLLNFPLFLRLLKNENLSQKPLSLLEEEKNRPA